MNTFIILFITSIFHFSIGLGVYLHNRRQHLNIIFGLLSFTVGLWTLLYSLSYLTAHTGYTLFATRFMTIPSFFYPSIFLYLAKFFPEQKYKPSKLFYLLHGAIISLLLAFCFSDHYIYFAEIVNNQVNFKFGYMYNFLNIYILMTMFYGMFLLCKKIFIFKDNERLQLICVFTGAFLSVFFGAVFCSILPALGYPNYNFFGPAATIFTIGFLALAVLKYRLALTRLIIKSLAYLVVVAMLVIFVGITLYYSQFYPSLLPFLILFITALFHFSIAVGIYLKNRHNRLNIVFALFSFTLGVWTLSYSATYLIALTNNLNLILFSTCFMTIPAFFYPSIFLYLAYYFPEGKYKPSKLFYLFHGIFILSLLPFCFSANYIYFAEVVNNQINFKFGYLYNLLTTYVVVTILFGVFILFKKIFTAQGNARIQLIYIFIGAFLGILFGGGFCAVLPAMGYPNYNFFGPAGTIFIIGFWAIAITKYELMDISVIINRTAARVLTNGFFIGIYGGCVYLFLTYVSQQINWLFIVFTVIFGVVVGECYQLVRQAIQTGAVDKWISDFYNSDNVFDEFAGKLLPISNLLDVACITALELKIGMKLQGVWYAILKKEHKYDKNYYQLYDANSEELMQLPAEHLLITYFAKTKEPVLYKNLPSEIVESLVELPFTKTCLFMPLYSTEKLECLIVLAEKTSQAPFYEKDLKFLNRIITYTLVVLDRMQPYEEIKGKYDKSLAFAETVARQASQASLINGIAHEIKNPLFMLKTKTDLLDKYLGDAEKMQKFAEDTRYCVKRTTQVLDKMLKYAKSGTEELEKSLLDIAPLIKEIVQLSATELQRRNIQLQTQFEPVAQVCVDETGLYQLVLNLLLNAIDAIEENGTITIDIREEAFMQQASMVNGVCITIKDTGCGISAENLQKLCEPFYTTKYSGQDQQHLGLGLSIALKIISEHQGLLDIESELGKGSTFKIHLPI